MFEHTLKILQHICCKIFNMCLAILLTRNVIGLKDILILRETSSNISECSGQKKLRKQNNLHRFAGSNPKFRFPKVY